MYQETVKGFFSEAPMYIRFRNDTDLPVNINSWVKGSNTLNNCFIQPKTNVLLHSSVGEWHMDSMFTPLIISDGTQKGVLQEIEGQPLTINKSEKKEDSDQRKSDEYRQMWADAGLEKHRIIGKFRSSPCAGGDYSWMEYDKPFDCVYSHDKDQIVPGLITLTYTSK
jgi:hypothetical protein